jgi:hypothetical protein
MRRAGCVGGFHFPFSENVDEFNDIQEFAATPVHLSRGRREKLSLRISGCNAISWRGRNSLRLAPS